MSVIVWTSHQISLVIQFITGIVGLYGLSIPLNDADTVLREVLGLELLVQSVEFLFYLGFLTILNLATLTQAR